MEDETRSAINISRVSTSHGSAARLYNNKMDKLTNDSHNYDTSVLNFGSRIVEKMREMLRQRKTISQ